MFRIARRAVPSLALIFLIGPVTVPAAAQDSSAWYPSRVLLTNDNGIDDPKLIALARAFAARAETWVVAPAADRSGSGASLTIFQTGALTLEARDLGSGIRAYAVDGTPADCVVLAMLGLMKAHLPELVISGINGGANLGAEWFGSGTIGAARIAALGGVPAIAVSGLDTDQPGSLKAATDWVMRLAGSRAVRSLVPPEYLTVSLPHAAPADIRGVRFGNRAPLRLVPRLAPENERTWRVVGMDELTPAPPAGSDEALWARGYVVVVPMRADEVDAVRLVQRQRGAGVLPPWPLVRDTSSGPRLR